MITALFGLCAITALACAILLLMAYRRTRSRLLWWSSLCFSGLFLSNVVLVFDKVVFSAIDLQPYRLFIVLASLMLMLYGLLYATEE